MCEIYPIPGKGVWVFPTPGTIASLLKDVLRVLEDLQFWAEVEQTKFSLYVCEQIQRILGLLDYIILVLKEKEELEAKK